MSLIIRSGSVALVVSLLAFAGCSEEDSTSKSPRPASSSSGGAGSSFKNDVAPIIATNCALAACHSSKESNLNFFVTYEPAQIYTELMKTSPTCGASKFVVAGKPEESMLMLKMDGEQAKLPTDCTSARRSEMPPGELIAKEERDIVRAWIAAGAKDD